MQNKGVFTIGLVLILFGIIFLLTNLGTLDLSYMWPSIPLLVGVGLILGYLNSRKDYGLLMPGSILVIISLLFFYCNAAGWRQMEYLWPIFILAPSCGFFLMYFCGVREKGLLVPAFILLAIGLIFLMINTYLGVFWPILLIIAGLVLIAINLIRKPNQVSEEGKGQQPEEKKPGPTETDKSGEKETAKEEKPGTSTKSVGKKIATKTRKDSNQSK